MAIEFTEGHLFLAKNMQVTKKHQPAAAQWRCGAATHCAGDGLGASDLEVIDPVCM